jgi:hypothetical protein
MSRCLAILLCPIFQSSAIAAASCETLQIETPVATLSLNTKSCDLVAVLWHTLALEVIREPPLEENFRLLLPRRDY